MIGLTHYHGIFIRKVRSSHFYLILVSACQFDDARVASTIFLLWRRDPFRVSAMSLLHGNFARNVDATSAAVRSISRSLSTASFSSSTRSSSTCRLLILTRTSEARSRSTSCAAIGHEPIVDDAAMHFSKTTMTVLYRYRSLPSIETGILIGHAKHPSSATSLAILVHHV